VGPKVATIASYDAHIEQLVDVAERLKAAFDEAGVDYRIVGGLAVFLHVRDRDPLAARTTRDVDVAVRRNDLEQIRAAAAGSGFEFRHAAGVDMLVDRESPSVRSAVHFVFLNEKVQPDYLEPVPAMPDAVRSTDGLLLGSVADLVTMKLTSFRLKDQVHIQDIDGVGLITDEMEQGLSSELRKRLEQVRAQR
jgi:hypothetical protein